MTPGPEQLKTWLTARPIAHRGLHDRRHGIVENSRSAFAAAIAHDYTIECDLQLSADGEAMVFHDATLDRLAGRTGRVDRMTAAHLAAIPLKGSTDHPQTLADLLADVDDRVGLVIEMKSHWDGDDRLARRTCEIIADYAGRAALMSFDPVQVAAVRTYAPDIPRGGVSDLYEAKDWPELTGEQRAALRTGETMALAEPHFMSYSVAALPTEPAQSFRAGGGPVICWTVRDPQTARDALKLCDQITFEGFLA